jgi:hypothetical protein
MTDFKFQPGDRVAERPRVKLNIASTAQGQAVFNRQQAALWHGDRYDHSSQFQGIEAKGHLGAVGRIAAVVRA